MNTDDIKLTYFFWIDSESSFNILIEYRLESSKTLLSFDIFYCWCSIKMKTIDEFSTENIFSMLTVTFLSTLRTK